MTLDVINRSYYKDDRITLWLYYEVDDGILVFEEIPTYTWATMISNIGGQLGLWTGASLLTGLELIYLLTHVCVTNWRSNQREKADNKKRQQKEATIRNEHSQGDGLDKEMFDSHGGQV